MVKIEKRPNYLHLFNKKTNIALIAKMSTILGLMAGINEEGAGRLGQVAPKPTNYSDMRLKRLRIKKGRTYQAMALPFYAVK